MSLTGRAWRKRPSDDAFNNEGLFNKRGKAVAATFAKKVNTCAVCAATALTRVGAKGYCKVHKPDALAHAKKLGRIREYFNDVAHAKADIERIDE